MPSRSSLLATTLALCVLGGSGLADGGSRDPALELELAWQQARDGAADPAAVSAEHAARFRALAAAGSGRARLWLLEHWREAQGLAPDAALDARALRDKLGLARDLVREHAHQAGLLNPRFLRVLEADRDLALEDVRDLAIGLAATATSPELAAGALLALTRRTAPPDEADPARQSAARDLCEDLLARWPDSAAARVAAEELWRLEHLAVGRLAPDFVAYDVMGNELRSTDLRGRVVVVDVWSFEGAGWGPQLSLARRWRERLWDERFTWLGVNLDPDPDAFRRACEDRDIDWTQHAWEGGALRPVRAAWHVGRRPQLVLLDDRGVVRGVDLEPAELEARIASLLVDLREKIAARETALETALEDAAQRGR